MRLSVTRRSISDQASLNEMFVEKISSLWEIVELGSRHLRSPSNTTAANDGSRFHSGVSTLARTSSITCSGEIPSNNMLIAATSLPYCMLRSFSGSVTEIRCLYTFRAASATKEGVI